MAKELVAILKPFEVATAFFSNEENYHFCDLYCHLQFSGGIKREQQT